MRHIVSATDLTLEELLGIYAAASRHKITRKHARPEFANLILLIYFFESSLRTQTSTATAMMRLGGNVYSTENAAQFSTIAKKGESLEQAVRIVSGNVDFIAMRHPDSGAAAQAAAVSRVPFINCGDGDNEHPTQAYLDLFTLLEQAPGRPLRILFFGDNRDSRTVRSLVLLLALHARELSIEVAQVGFCGPFGLDTCAPYLIEMLERAGIEVMRWGQEPPPPESVDVVYLTRSQKERRLGEEQGEVLVYPLWHARALPDDAVIMHPLPSNAEFPDEAMLLPQAKHEVQADNGQFVRMALFEFLQQNR